MKRGRSRLAGLLGSLVLVLAACGDSPEVSSVDEPTGGATSPAPPASRPPSTAHDDDPQLPFGLGPGIVRGGDDVVADGFEVPLDRFVDQVEAPPEDVTATAHRLGATPEDEARVQEAAAALLGHTEGSGGGPGEIDIHFDGAWFEFHAEGYGHDARPPPTTTPSDADGLDIDEDSAVSMTTAFLAAAALEPAGEPTAYPAGGFLTVEVPIALAGPTPVLRAVASVTFRSDGLVIGGYGPFGGPAHSRPVPVVDVHTAVRRLALTRALVGHPTTTSAPDEAPVVLVAAELVLSLRQVVGADGVPTDERWLVPVYRFEDEAGHESEVIAVHADHLRMP